MEQKIINKLLKLAKKAYDINEIPVSAIVVCNNEIVSEAYNLKEKKKDITAHAEILAIKKAAKKLDRWNLSDCDIYVTLKPCSMCNEVIKNARIKNIYYLIEKLDYKKEYDKTNCNIINNINEKYELEYKKMLSDFFKTKTNR